MKPIQMKAIKKDTATYLYEQVIELIYKLMHNADLQPGDKLPSLRQMSRRFEISVPTVKQAYEELERQGFVEAREKSGYFLTAYQKNNRPKRAKMVNKPVPVRRQTLIEQVHDAMNQSDVFPLGISNPAFAANSDKALTRTMRRVMAKAGDKALYYAPMEGFPELKSQLAHRYFDTGLMVDPDNIVITNGAQEALTIALLSVAKQGDVIAVESPTYFGILELIESLGMLALEIPACSSDGICLDDLQYAIQNHPIKACIFASSINNPLGSLMNNERRAFMVDLLEHHDIPLIEDDVYGELYFGDNRSRLAQSYSKKGLVFTCSSFSKTAAPSYRIGWVVNEKYNATIKRLKRALSCSSSLLNQWTLSEFISSGEYDKNLRKLRVALRCNKERMINLITQFFPSTTRVSDPQGGCVLWLELSAQVDTSILFHQAIAQGISIAPGTIFSPRDKFKRNMRLSYGLPWSDQVASSIEQLGTLLVDKKT